MVSTVGDIQEENAVGKSINATGVFIQEMQQLMFQLDKSLF